MTAGWIEIATSVKNNYTKIAIVLNYVYFECRVSEFQRFDDFAIRVEIQDFSFFDIYCEAPFLAIQ